MKMETSVGESHTKMVRGMELKRNLMNKGTSPKPTYGKDEELIETTKP